MGNVKIETSYKITIARFGFSKVYQHCQKKSQFVAKCAYIEFNLIGKSPGLLLPSINCKKTIEAFQVRKIALE